MKRGEFPQGPRINPNLDSMRSSLFILCMKPLLVGKSKQRNVWKAFSFAFWQVEFCFVNGNYNPQDKLRVNNVDYLAPSNTTSQRKSKKKLDWNKNSIHPNHKVAKFTFYAHNLSLSLSLKSEPYSFQNIFFLLFLSCLQIIIEWFWDNLNVLPNFWTNIEAWSNLTI